MAAWFVQSRVMGVTATQPRLVVWTSVLGVRLLTMTTPPCQ